MNETGGPSPEQMGVRPEPATDKSRLDEHGEIIVPNEREKGALERQFLGWWALAKHAWHLYRTGNLNPRTQPGKVTANLESLKNQLDNAQYVNVTPEGTLQPKSPSSLSQPQSTSETNPKP